MKTESSGPAKEMPRYKCHKEVWALKIKDIISSPNSDEITIIPEDEGYSPFPVSSDYASKHKPQAGGYYVVYKDGYASFSPAGAFEDGYTKI